MNNLYHMALFWGCSWVFLQYIAFAYVGVADFTGVSTMVHGIKMKPPNLINLIYLKKSTRNPILLVWPVIVSSVYC